MQRIGGVEPPGTFIDRFRLAYQVRVCVFAVMYAYASNLHAYARVWVQCATALHACPFAHSRCVLSARHRMPFHLPTIPTLVFLSTCQRVSRQCCLLLFFSHSCTCSGGAGQQGNIASISFSRTHALVQVAQGMEALESLQPPILHRDLKPSNVFIDGAGHARVADLGLARWVWVWVQGCGCGGVHVLSSVCFEGVCLEHLKLTQSRIFLWP